MTAESRRNGRPQHPIGRHNELGHDRAGHQGHERHGGKPDEARDHEGDRAGDFGAANDVEKGTPTTTLSARCHGDRGAQREVLSHLVAGRTYAENARTLFTSEKTVSAHVSTCCA